MKMYFNNAELYLNNDNVNAILMATGKKRKNTLEVHCNNYVYKTYGELSVIKAMYNDLMKQLGEEPFSENSADTE